MTPWQLKVCLDGFKDRKESEHQNTLWKIWHLAAFIRGAKLPRLKDLLARKNQPVKLIDESAIVMQFRAYQSRKRERDHG